jgi:hypothetical protein
MQAICDAKTWSAAAAAHVHTSRMVACMIGIVTEEASGCTAAGSLLKKIFHAWWGGTLRRVCGAATCMEIIV